MDNQTYFAKGLDNLRHIPRQWQLFTKYGYARWVQGMEAVS